MIYAPARNTDPAMVTSYIQNAVKLFEAFPDFGRLVFEHLLYLFVKGSFVVAFSADIGWIAGLFLVLSQASYLVLILQVREEFLGGPLTFLCN